MRKSLQEWGAWGNQILGEARTQAAPILQQAADHSSTYIKTGADSLRKGVSNVKFMAGIGETHNFKDPHTGENIVVGEINLLAEGGFGSVVLVKDTTSGEEFAMKKINCQEGVQVASTAEAAKREAQVLKSIPVHPHIIRCYGFSSEASGPNNSLVKILLEFCPRGHLLDFMEQHNGMLSLGQILTPFVQVAAAVRHLHYQKPPIQHRDLKAENILRFSDKVWKLCDFGSCSTKKHKPADLSRKELQDLQDDIDKTVTLLYRPPEMADVSLNSRNGTEIGEAVDLWMLGCVFYTLVFYKHPFQDNPTVLAISNAKYFIPRDHPNAKDAKLSCIVHWLLSASPNDRPTSQKLCEVLREFPKLSSEQLQAMAPPSVSEKMKRYAELYDSRRADDDLADMPDLGSLTGSVNAVLQARKELDDSAPNGGRSAKARPKPPAATPPPGEVDFADFADFTSSASASAAPMPPPAAANHSGGFDIAFALAGGPPQQAAAPSNPSSASSTSKPQQQEPQRLQRPRAKTTPAEPDNLLDMSPDPPQPLRHLSSPAGLDDLLGDLMSSPAPAQRTTPPMNPAPQQAAPVLGDFDNFMSAAPAPAAAVQAPVQPAAAPLKPQPAADNGGGSFWADFAN